MWPLSPPPDLACRYTTFVRIGSGLSFADYVWVRQKPWKPWDPKNPPAFLQTTKRGHEDKGDVYIEPAECVIFLCHRAPLILSKLLYSEGQSSGNYYFRFAKHKQLASQLSMVLDEYHLGITMRFPRALVIREDLSIADCMTASGKQFHPLCSSYSPLPAVLESMRAERKRKMESEAR